MQSQPLESEPPFDSSRACLSSSQLTVGSQDLPQEEMG